MDMPKAVAFDDGAAGHAQPPVRILVVDDEPRLRRSMRMLVAAAGREISECGTGTEALSLAATGGFDLLLLDLHLPDMTGLDVMDRLARRDGRPVVILVSADDRIDSAIGALRRGAYDFVRKPSRPEELCATVDNAVRRLQLERANAAMEARLAQSERLHRYLVDHSPDMIYTVNERGEFTYVNPTAVAVLGRPPADLVGRPFWDVVLEDDHDRARFAFCERRTGERASRNVELRLKRPVPAAASGVEAVTIVLSATGVYQDPPEGAGERRFLGSYGVARDITERKRAEEKITFQAYHDLLTRLPNRALFKDRLGVALSQARRQERCVAVLFIDLDRFKVVNDSLGHAEGDELLKLVAARLQGCVRRSDTLARLGGDEFTILLSDLADVQDAAIIAHKVLEELRRPVQLAGQDFRVSASIGIALFPADGDDAETLVKHADIAMYHVKAAGRNDYAFFSREMNAAFRQRLTIETDLRRALDVGELELWYQPQVSVRRRAIVGMEALLRWRHPERGLLSPDIFIPVAEEAGLIGRISEWVLETACLQLARWRTEGFEDLRMSINLSARDFDRPDLADRVFAVIDRHGIPAQRIKLEITESLMMRDTDPVIETVSRLRQGGVQVAIDDFGTQFAAFGYLQKYPVSSIKIDQVFVHDLSAERPYSPILVAIAGIAHGFDLKLIAEGVENPLQRDVLLGLGCDEMQGFLFGEPVPVSEARMALAAPVPQMPGSAAVH